MRNAIMKNEMEMIFDAISDNEGLARLGVAAFITECNPTLEELADVKTAVSEAVTNAIIHGYDNDYGCGRHPGVRPAFCKMNPGKVRMHCLLEEGHLTILIEDWGKGIEDVGQAMEPLFTTKPDLQRSGMGFSFMEAFMDSLQVESTPGEGTKVHMEKKLKAGSWIDCEEE